MTPALRTTLWLSLALAACTPPAPPPRGLRLEVAEEPRARVGQPGRLRLEVVGDDGRPVERLDLLHGQPLHLLAVSADLEELQHLHPTPLGHGRFAVDLTPRRASPLALFAEVAPTGDPGGPRLLRRDLLPEGARPGRARLAAASAFDGRAAQRVTAGAALVTLASLEAPLVAGAPATLRVTVEDAATGAPLAPEPWLGLPAHAIAVSEDLERLLHLHAGSQAAHGGHHGHHRAAPSGGTPPGPLELPVTFPAPGLYRLWIQLSTRGELVTAPFVVEAR